MTGDYLIYLLYGFLAAMSVSITSCVVAGVRSIFTGVFSR